MNARLIRSAELMDAALSRVDRAGDAIEIARRLAVAGDPSYRRFLKLMLGSVKIARTRTT